MHLSTATRQLAGATLSLEILRRKHVQALSLDDVEIDRWPLYRCLHAEIEHEGHVYLLSNGRWFRGDPDFVQSVNRATEAVPIIDICLPLFSLDDRVEADYNSRVANLQPDRFACLDRRPIMFGGGRSRVEACDLYSAESDFIHVKRYSGSSDLSHLFAQGIVAGESFARSHEYREAVSALLPASLRFTPIRNHLTRDQFRVIYAVISRSESRLRLPFFARLNLKRAHEVLSSLGFGVALVDIKVAKEKSTLRRSRNVRKVF